MPVLLPSSTAKRSARWTAWPVLRQTDRCAVPGPEWGFTSEGGLQQSATGESVGGLGTRRSRILHPVSYGAMAALVWSPGIRRRQPLR